MAYKLAAERPLEIEDTATDVGLPQKLSFKIWMRNDRNVPNAAIPLEPKRCPLFGSRRRSLFDRDGEGFRALQRTKASHAGTRVGSGTELWGFVFWLGREAAVRSCKTTEATARDATSTIIIEVRNVDLSSFGGRVAPR